MDLNNSLEAKLNSLNPFENNKQDPSLVRSLLVKLMLSTGDFH